MAESASHPAGIFFEQSITWLYTDDLDRLVGFYRDVMALPQVLDQGRCKVFRMSPTGFLGVCDRPGRPRGTKGMMVTFLVQDVEKAHAHFATKGVVFDGPPTLSPNGTVYSCFFHDPEGYWLELQEFRDPRWPYPEHPA